MSLPYLFGTGLDSIPSRESYLRAPKDKVEFWHQKLGPKSKFRIGIVWSGGFRVDQPELWAVNNRRNISLEQILSLLQDDRFEWYSLQKGEPAESELANYLKNAEKPLILRNYTADLKDFSDTAALVENLDLVISVDTSTAHLAAALGKPTWILNRFDTCWRWLVGRLDSPWYPSVRLFSQKSSGQWSEPIREIQVELNKL